MLCLRLGLTRRVSGLVALFGKDSLVLETKNTDRKKICAHFGLSISCFGYCGLDNFVEAEGVERYRRKDLKYEEIK